MNGGMFLNGGSTVGYGGGDDVGECNGVRSEGTRLRSLARRTHPKRLGQPPTISFGSLSLEWNVKMRRKRYCSRGLTIGVRPTGGS